MSRLDGLLYRVSRKCCRPRKWPEKRLAGIFHDSGNIQATHFDINLRVLA